MTTPEDDVTPPCLDIQDCDHQFIASTGMQLMAFEGPEGAVLVLTVLDDEGNPVHISFPLDGALQLKAALTDAFKTIQARYN